MVGAPASSPVLEHDAQSATVPVTDYYRWAFEQAALIRAGRFDEIDLANVADEIEDVAKSEVRALRSNIESILVHLLKWHYQPERRCRPWELSIEEHRRRVEETLGDSASLATLWDRTVASAYTIAYTWTEIMDRAFDLAAPGATGLQGIAEAGTSGGSAED